MIYCVGCISVAGCKPNCCTQPRAAPWGNDVALIKVSRSVRATCFMRGNAPWGVKGVMGYALSARGIFAPAQKCRMYQSRSTFSQGAALGYGQHLGYGPPLRSPCTNVHINAPLVAPWKRLKYVSSRARYAFISP